MFCYGVYISQSSNRVPKYVNGWVTLILRHWAPNKPAVYMCVLLQTNLNFN